MSGVARKFGGGKSAVGTPSLGWSSVVVVVSLLTGASIVHSIYKPDLDLLRLYNMDKPDLIRACWFISLGLTLPPVESEEKDSGAKQDTEKPKPSGS